MMIARWHAMARFGHKQEAIALMKEWNEKIGAQTGVAADAFRLTTGSVGANEALIESEFQIDGLGDLQAFFDKIASIQMHADWGKRMGEVVVSGSTHWQVLRIV